MTAADALAEARARIATEAAQRTGSLDLRGIYKLESLPVELSKLRHLRSLDCSQTQVSDLTPLAGLTTLQRLDCSQTQVSDLTPLANLTDLQELNCSDTEVSDLTPLAGLTNLQELNCWHTEVSDLTPLANLTDLQELDCSQTQVSDLTPLANLTDLQELNCGDTRVSDLTPLAGLTTLQRLDCYGTQVSDLTPLANLTDLRSLNCSFTQVSNLTPLANLTDLQELNCSDTEVSDLTPLAGLTNLQELNCWHTEVSDLTPLANLTDLQELDCSQTQVSDLTPLANLTDLQELNCGDTRVSDLTPLAGLTTLQRLDCYGTQVSDLTPLANLTDLRSLNCWHTEVSDLTPLANLTDLQELNCWHTEVSDLTPLADLTNLQRLDCSVSQVSDLTPLANLTNLQELNCSFTQVSDLTPLANLTDLQELNCSATQVSDLTPLANLTDLQKLDCSGCRLGALPPAIYANPALKNLVLWESHVPGLPREVLSKTLDDNCLANVRAHFADQSAGTTAVAEVKLFLLGNGGAGKTQIARWLAGEPFDPAWDSTHGIRILGKPRAGSVAAKLRLQMWDFGGQDIYHGTHALFMRSPALMLLVWAKDRENQERYDHDGLSFRNLPLAYWLAIARLQGSRESPVLLVQTKCDRKEDEARQFPVAPEALDALPYGAELRVSPATGRGLGALEETLGDAIGWLRDPARLGLVQIGAGRLRVQRRLEALREADQDLPAAQRRHRLLERAAFEAICAEEGGVSSTEALLAYLDRNGTVCYRSGLFHDQIVLDQGWALEAIYAVFDRKLVFRALRHSHGRFTRGLLGLLVWQAHEDEEQKLLLSMMQSCGICFCHRKFTHDNDGDDDDAEYIAPDLLPERPEVARELAARWDETLPGEYVEFGYDLLHGGLIRSVMAEIGAAAGVDGLYWRGGLCVFEAETHSRILIEEAMSGDWQGLIRVRTQGGQAAAALGRAMTVIERVQDSLGMRPTAVTPSVLREQPRTQHQLSFSQEKPATAEWYVSYAWRDDSPEGQAREQVVDQLCAAAEARGRTILRDKQALDLGDRISRFMNRLGAGDRVFIILSDKYLRSPFCMFELSEVWRTSRQEGEAFLKRVRVYTLPDAKVQTPDDWTDWAIHWQQEHDKLDAKARQYGATILGEHGQRRLMLMQRFYCQVTDILATLADSVQPRKFEDLERYGLEDGSADTP